MTCTSRLPSIHQRPESPTATPFQCPARSNTTWSVPFRQSQDRGSAASLQSQTPRIQAGCLRMLVAPLPPAGLAANRTTRMMQRGPMRHDTTLHTREAASQIRMPPAATAVQAGADNEVAVHCRCSSPTAMIRGRSAAVPDLPNHALRHAGALPRLRARPEVQARMVRIIGTGGDTSRPFTGTFTSFRHCRHRLWERRSPA